MRILLLGARGQLGFELRFALTPFADVTALARDDLDLSQLESLRDALRSSDWDVLINATAYTDVDRAEQETAMAFQVNADVVQVLGDEAARAKRALIHFSTDFVFDGKSGEPYTEDAPTHPLNAAQ